MMNYRTFTITDTIMVPSQKFLRSNSISIEATRSFNYDASLSESEFRSLSKEDSIKALVYDHDIPNYVIKSDLYNARVWFKDGNHHRETGPAIIQLQHTRDSAHFRNDTKVEIWSLGGIYVHVIHSMLDPYNVTSGARMDASVNYNFEEFKEYVENYLTNGALAFKLSLKRVSDLNTRFAEIVIPYYNPTLT